VTARILRQKQPGSYGFGDRWAIGHVLTSDPVSWSCFTQHYISQTVPTWSKSAHNMSSHYYRHQPLSKKKPRCVIMTQRATSWWNICRNDEKRENLQYLVSSYEGLVPWPQKRMLCLWSPYSHISCGA